MRLRWLVLCLGCGIGSLGWAQTPSPTACDTQSSVVLDWQHAPTDGIRFVRSSQAAIWVGARTGAPPAPGTWMALQQLIDSLNRLPLGNFVFTDYTLYLRIPLCNPTDEHQLWYLQGIPVDTMSLYWPQGLPQHGGPAATLAFDDTLRLRLQPDIVFHATYASIAVMPHSADTLQLRVRSRRPLNLNYRLVPVRDTVLNDRMRGRTLEAMVTAGVWVMLGFNLLLLAWIRSRAHLTYLLLVTALHFGVQGDNVSLTTDLLGWPLARTEYVASYLKLLIGPLLLLFLYRFLDLQHYLPRRGRWVYFWLAAVVVALCLAVTLIYTLRLFGNAYVDTIQTYTLLTGGCFLLAPVLGVYVWRKGHPTGWLLALSQFSLLLGVLVYILALFGFFRALSFVTMFQAALVVEMLVFSMAFMIRFNLQRKALAAAALEKQQLLETENQRLEQQVAERTEEIRSQSEELRVQNEQLNDANLVIAETNRSLTDSIVYAQRLQASLLPTAEELAAVLPRHGLLYQPRDIVSGDFYWAAVRGGMRYVALGDATGHGVPGALMTVLALTLLQEEVQRSAAPPGPAALVARVDEKLQLALRQRSGGAQDGFDLAVAAWDGSGQVQLFGAGRSMLVLRAGAWERVLPGRPGLGGSGLPSTATEAAAAHVLDWQPGMRLCFYTDGITDQFGGQPPRKLVRKGLVAWLAATQHLPPSAQAEALATRLTEWQGAHRRLDDVSLLVFDIG